MAKIEIDLDTLFTVDYGLDGEAVDVGTATDILRDAVVRGIVDRLASDRNLIDEMRKKVSYVINKNVEERVLAILDDIFAGPIQQTTAWGERRGEPTTIKEIVRKKVEEFLTNAARRDTFGGNAQPQNLSEVVAEQTRTILTGEFRKEIDAAKKGVTDKVRQEALAAAVRVLNGERA